MNESAFIVVDNLLMPVLATKERISEIKNNMDSSISPVALNGLFLMSVSYVESMQKEILTYYLKYNPRKIPVKKTFEIDKDTLSENEDFNFIESLISDYIDHMSYKQLMEIFFKVLNIDKPLNLQEIINIKKRRNDLIHDNMIVHYKQKKVTINHIDSEYLNCSLEEYVKYLDSLNKYISKKYSKCTRINALSNLWHYTFRSPLCANFEEHWHIDTQSDSISGYKISAHENGLSHSEKFLINIWRSQVSNCKVEFINMASFGKHMQSCLYMFLKLSNDIFMY